jgi:predicted GNAT family N-acyltransferase
MINLLASLQIHRCSFQDFRRDIAPVRETVFQQEQGVDSTLDWDGLDDQCDHLVAYILKKPVGVARLRSLDATIAKLERVAVLKVWRGLGIGQALVNAAIDVAITQGVTILTLHAQLPSVPFYEALGFNASGQSFLEAGIEHLKMIKKLQHDRK